MKTLDRRAPWGPPQALPPLPVLREKEKEKKRGAVLPLYGGAGPGVGVLSGGGIPVGVGTSLAVRTGLLGRLAAVLAGLAGGPATVLGRLFASAAGRWLVGTCLGAAAFLFVAAAARFIGSFQEVPEADFPTMGQPRSADVAIPDRAGRSLDYVVAPEKAGAGDAPAKPAPKPHDDFDAPAPTEPEAPEVSPIEDAGRIGPLRDALAPMGWGGGREGASFGGGAGTFGAPGGAGGPAGAAARSKGGASLEPAKAGKLRGVERARRALGTRRLARPNGRSSRAMGQLKLANALSMLGATSPSEQTARFMAGDAFDQSPSGGKGVVGLTGGLLDPLGSGAPDLGVRPGVPDVPAGVNVTPYQNQIDNARGMGDQAAGLKNAGMEMLMMGLALMAAGAALMAMPPPANAAGIALMAAGAAMMAMGMGMLQKAQDMAQQAKDQGKGIEERYGQPEQGGIVGQCAQQAANTGIAVDGCAARNPDGNVVTHVEVRKATEEEGRADFKPVPPVE